LRPLSGTPDKEIWRAKIPDLNRLACFVQALLAEAAGAAEGAKNRLFRV
jgi:hypothetical protein